MGGLGYGGGGILFIGVGILVMIVFTKDELKLVGSDCVIGRNFGLVRRCLEGKVLGSLLELV